jgi:tetratricopeptide (TPR) repeat protein
MQSTAAPARPRVVAGAVGDSASPDAVRRLTEAVSALKLQAILPLLHQAVIEVQADRHAQAAELALKALEIDEKCGVGWHVLAVAREKAGDYTTALRCYDTALQLNPDEAELANDLGRLAYAMNMKEEAESLFTHYLARRPENPDGINNLACCQRDQLRFDEAIETVRPALMRLPGNAMLWNTLGTIMAEMGEMVQSTTFFNEALALDPGFAKARYNRGNAFLALGDLKAALADCEASIPGVTLASEVAMMRLARATILIASGDLEAGWDAYEERLNPGYPDVTHYACDAPQWTPQMDLAGKRLLLIGEQGLGDEVLFANILPDLIEALGPEGRLSLAVEKRLVPLFRQSFPTIEVGEHATAKVDHHTLRFAPFTQDRTDIDAWAPLASMLRLFRRSVDAFPDRKNFLTADPKRVAHWKKQLAKAGPGPKVGVLWKSLKIDSGRFRYFSPFDAWKPVLQTPGVTFVNLQYGDCAEELAQAKAELGVDIWTPPGIDLKDDLADLAALCCALDLTVGPANATTNIAGAAGAPMWLISTPGAWPRLGTDRYPWYPQARVFLPEAYNQWGPVMAEVAAAVGELAKTPRLSAAG